MLKKIPEKEDQNVLKQQLEINEKKQNLCEGQHQDFMLLMQNMQSNTMKLMETVVQQMKNK